jgi:hypothetical protein
MGASSVWLLNTSEGLKKAGKLLKMRISYCYGAVTAHRRLFKGTNRYSRDGFHNLLYGDVQGTE